MFRLWSQLNPKIKTKLKPDLGLRDWSSLNERERHKIWRYLSDWFFDVEEDYRGKGKYVFTGNSPTRHRKELRISFSISSLNDRYKVNSYAPNFLASPDLESACKDFHQIFMRSDENVVLELLSLYSLRLIRKDEENSLIWEDFDEFSSCLNGILDDFGVNLHLTRRGFAPRQDKKITEEIYEPVIKILSDPKWKKVNDDLSGSFDDYRKNRKKDYSTSVTKAISALQAFLQILVYGKTGKGKIRELIRKAQNKKLIPDDQFTTKIFNNVESILARERKETSDAHPKKSYATEKNARLVLNLIMIFIQHCIQN